jgi:hypothetical protein
MKKKHNQEAVAETKPLKPGAKLELEKEQENLNLIG